MSLAPVQEDRIGHRLLAEEDVVGDRQDRDEHEVLVDHADAAGDRIGRTGDRDRRTVEQDLAGIRCREAVQDVHQRRLAGAVLAEQRVDLARPDVEIDPVVCNDARIALGDPAHLECGSAHGLRHGVLSFDLAVRTEGAGPGWSA